MGGAGAQREIGAGVAKSLRKKLDGGELRVNLVAVIYEPVKNYFERKVKEYGLGGRLNKNIFILYEAKRENYFAKFNQIMKTTGILWNKPSEFFSVVLWHIYYCDRIFGQPGKV